RILAEVDGGAGQAVGDGRALFTGNGKAGAAILVVGPHQLVAIQLQALGQAVAPAETQATIQFCCAGAVQPVPGEGQQAFEGAVGEGEQLLAGDHRYRAVVGAGLVGLVRGFAVGGLGRGGGVVHRLDLLERGGILRFAARVDGGVRFDLRGAGASAGSRLTCAVASGCPGRRSRAVYRGRRADLQRGLACRLRSGPATGPDGRGRAGGRPALPWASRGLAELAWGFAWPWLNFISMPVKSWISSSTRPPFVAAPSALLPTRTAKPMPPVSTTQSRTFSSTSPVSSVNTSMQVCGGSMLTQATMAAT